MGSSIWFLCANIYFKIAPFFPHSFQRYCHCVGIYISIPYEQLKWKNCFFHLTVSKNGSKTKIDSCWLYVTHCE